MGKWYTLNLGNLFTVLFQIKKCVFTYDPGPKPYINADLLHITLKKNCIYYKLYVSLHERSYVEICIFNHIV